ncbi:MAG: hypothetical protein Q8T04_07250, partial [Bacteroidota bacterium]|nr:hypothetical protein [Bacteroidota bacterium]
MNQVFAVFIMFLIGCSPQSTYYVDSQTGDDTNKGTMKKPFKSIEKVDSLKLLPGNSVLFAGGQSFAGTLKLKGLAGTKELPIVIGSYGNGRAILNGENENSIMADSCSWLQVKNLNVIGNGRLTG